MKIFYTIFFFSFGLMLSAQTEKEYDVINIEGNSSTTEIFTCIVDNTLYFLKSDKKNNISQNEEMVLMQALITEKGFEKVQTVRKNVTGFCLIKSTNKIVFSQIDNGKHQLYKADFSPDGEWKNIQQLPFSEIGHHYKQPFFSNQEEKLYFVSDRTDSFGGTDIYYVNADAHLNHFSNPIHLNYYVNSPKDEVFPSVSQGPHMYFASNGMNGTGGFDIYKVDITKNDFENTTNLGDPFNTSKDDLALFFTQPHVAGYFTSNRSQGKGSYDLYKFDTKINPSSTDCNTIKGYVKTKGTQKPIYEATVELFDEKGNNKTYLSDVNGYFEITGLKCIVTYEIVSYKEGYNGFSEKKSSPQQNDLITLWLDTEFPEGFKEEFDVKNELVIIDSKTNKEIVPEKPTLPKQENKIDVKSDIKNSDNKEVAIVNKTNLVKKEDYYDPLDYDPHTQPKKVKNADNTSSAEKETTKTTVVSKEQIDPLDYDPHTQRKNVPKTNENVKISTEDIKAKQTAEREQQLATAKTYAEELKKSEEQKLAVSTPKETTQKPTVVQPGTTQTPTIQDKINQEKAKQTAQREQQLAAAKTYAEELKKSEEQKLAVSTPKATTEKPTVIQPGTTQTPTIQDKINQEKAKQAAQREQQLAEAKTYAEELKKTEEQKLAVSTPKATTEKPTVIQPGTTQTPTIQDKINQEKAKQTAQREQQLATAKTYAEELKKSEEQKLAVSTPKATTEKPTVIQPGTTQTPTIQDKINQEKAKQTAQREQQLATAKTYAEELKKSEEQKLAVSTPKATTDKPTVIQPGTTQTPTIQDKINQEKSKQTAQREQQLAAAKTYAEELKKSEEQKLAVSTPKETTEKPTVVKPKTTQTPTIQDKINDRQKRLSEVKNYAEKLKVAEKLQRNNEEAMLLQQQVKITQTENKENHLEVPQQPNTDLNTPCQKNVEGYVKNALTQKPIEKTKIDMYFEGQNIESTSTDEKGYFNFINVDCNAAFTLICYKDGMDNIAKTNFNTFSTPNILNILIEPNTGHLAANQIQTKINNYKPIVSSNTVKTNSENKLPTLKPNQNKTIVAQDKTKPKTEDNNLQSQEENIILPKIEEGKVILNPIYFDLDEYYLTFSARKELDKIIVLMYQNPTMIIESGSHTDTRGDFEYNLILSEKRSQEAVGYLVANGVDPDRISGRGYGETMPVNHCLDGVKCTEQQHLQNRRTEFVILKY